MPLIESESRIWALVDHSESRCYGQGLSSGARVPFCSVRPCEQVTLSTVTLLFVIITGQGVTISDNCLRMCIPLMVSRGQHHIGITGQNHKTLSFCHNWAALPLLNETSQVKIIQTVWLHLYKVTQQSGHSFQCRSMKRKALQPWGSCHGPCMGEDGGNWRRAVKTCGGPWRTLQQNWFQPSFHPGLTKIHQFLGFFYTEKCFSNHADTFTHLTLLMWIRKAEIKTRIHMDKLVLKLLSVAGQVSTYVRCAQCPWLRDHYRCTQMYTLKQQRLLAFLYTVHC